MTLYFLVKRCIIIKQIFLDVHRLLKMNLNVIYIYLSKFTILQFSKVKVLNIVVS